MPKRNQTPKRRKIGTCPHCGVPVYLCGASPQYLCDCRIYSRMPSPMPFPQPVTVPHVDPNLPQSEPWTIDCSNPKPGVYPVPGSDIPLGITEHDTPEALAQKLATALNGSSHRNPGQRAIAEGDSVRFEIAHA